MVEFENVVRELLEFCDDLVDDIVFYNKDGELMPEEDMDFVINRYNELEKMAEEYGVTLS